MSQIIDIDEFMKNRGKVKVAGKGRRPTQQGEMNKLEKQYSEHLDALKFAGEIKEWWWDALTLKFAKDTRYRSDFLVLTKTDHLEIHETKGFMEDDAWVKLKTVAAIFPFTVLLVKRVKSAWVIKEVEMA